MDQWSIPTFDELVDSGTEPGWIEFAGGLTRIVRCNCDEPDGSADHFGEEDADYCRARAEVEARRAEEATHPAARDAHLELAGLYYQRAFAALQVEDLAVQECMSEGGSWLVDA